MSQVDELLLHFKGCLSREDEGGMIDVPAWYVKGAIAALETAKPAPEPAPSPGDVQGSGSEALRLRAWGGTNPDGTPLHPTVREEMTAALANPAPAAGDVREAIARDLLSILAGKRGQASTERIIKEAIVALSASPASAPGSGVRVKPLEWEQPEPDWWDVYDRALQIGYAVNQRRDGSVRLRVPGETSFAIFAGSVEEAKAAAQADFEQRIRSALDASPSPPETREAVETEREACARVAEDKANTKDFRARMVIAAAIRARGQS